MMQSKNVEHCLNILHNVVVITSLDNKIKCVYADHQEFNLYLDDHEMIEALQLCDAYNVGLEYVMAIRDIIERDIKGENGLMINFYRSSQNMSMLDELHSKSIHLPAS